MFRPEPMQKIKAISLDKHRKELVEELHNLGAVQIQDIREKTESPEWEEFLQSAELPTEARELAPLVVKVDRLLDIFDSVLGNKQNFLGLDEKIDPVKIKEISTEELLEKGYAVLKKLDVSVIMANSKLENIKSEISSLKNLKETHKILELFNIEPEHLEETERTISFIGFLENNILKEFSEKLEKEINDIIFEKEKIDKDKTAVLVATFAENKSNLSLILRQFGFEELEIPKLNIKKSEIENKLQKLNSDKKEKEDALKKTAEIWKVQLKVLKEQLEIKKEQSDIVSSMGSTKRTFIFEGWIPERNRKEVEEGIKKVCKDCIHIEFEEPEENDKVPVLLKNSKILKPFEMLTDMYSTPSHAEADPTTILSISLVIFAGLMLTDFVYGLLFLAFGIYLWKRAPAYQESAISLGKIVVALGASTMFFGVLTGSYLGDLPQYIFGLSPEKLALWVDPLTNPLAILSFALIVGLIHLNIGLLIGIYNNMLKKKYRSIISEQIIWFMLQAAAFVLIGGMLGITEFSLTAQYIAYALTGISLAILLKANGIIGLFDITGFLGDFISYSRLLALALATGGIAMTFNLLAGMVWGVPYIGFILGILIFIVGHIFSFALNALGAFIHGIRLHYVEFFSKFYEGGGNKFEPFKLTRRFTRI